MSELLGVLVGFLLTICIYSYLVGDNPLYRFGVHLLVGVSAAYAAVIAFNTVIWPQVDRFLAQPASPENLPWIVPLLLAVLLLVRWIGPLAWMGDSTVGVLVTVGAAVALVGVISGTLLPQLLATHADNAFLGLLTALLTVCALLYFQFTGGVDREGTLQPSLWKRAVTNVGQAVLMVTFGALFAGALGTSLTILVERVGYFMTRLVNLLGPYWS